MKLSAIKNRKGITSISALALIGVISIGQSGAFIASADVVSDVTTVTSTECTSTPNHLIVLTGNFPSPVTEVAVDYQFVDQALWTQTPTKISVRIPAGNSAPSMVLFMYGTGQFETLSVSCAGLGGPNTDTTEDGGLLPDTGSNNYNSLVAGLGLALVGVTGLLRRKSVKL
jgi:LPXTG-motif cell wall-anchored protein